MASINDMKIAVKQMMAQRYAGQGAYQKVDDNAIIEAQHFMRSQDAVAVRKRCKSGNFTISFRVAGEHTLTRIAAGNPCKGHTIMTKSIKEAGSNTYTYTGLTKDQFDKYKGLVGYPDGNGALAGIWKVGSTRPEQQKLDAVRLEANLTGHFTGDYDMHDLLKGGARILAGTPDEESAIEVFNAAMLEADAARKDNVARSLSGTTARLRTSEYALIRHGAQTSFMSYLLGSGCGEIPPRPNTSSLPFEDAVMNISPKICLFDAAGDAYILDGLPSIYKFYKDNNLLDQISFYYFFKDLRAVAANAPTLNSFADQINAYIYNCYK